jgi:hypothetical protein
MELAQYYIDLYVAPVDLIENLGLCEETVYGAAQVNILREKVIEGTLQVSVDGVMYVEGIDFRAHYDKQHTTIEFLNQNSATLQGRLVNFIYEGYVKRGQPVWN